MWSSFKDFIHRHRRKFYITGAVVAGSYIIGKYLHWKFDEWRQKQTEEYIAHARKQHHFDSNQRTCSITLISLLPSLKEALMNALDAEAITNELRQKPANKLDLWEELKIVSFTRTVCSIYSSCMLFLFLRVQLNIIGGYMYLDSFFQLDVEGNACSIRVGSDLQKLYLANVKYLLEEGLEQLCASVRRAVEGILNSISLKQKFTYADTQRLFQHIRHSIEFNTPSLTGTPSQKDHHTLTKFILPNDAGTSGDTQVNGMSGIDCQLDTLLAETLDVIESEDFQSVLTKCLDVGFVEVMNRMKPFFEAEQENSSPLSPTSSPPSSPRNGFVSASLPLAKVIPIVSGQIHHIFIETDNSYLQELLSVECARDFSANIYEAFSSEV